MKNALVTAIILLGLSNAYAKTQIISCLGSYQEGTLSISAESVSVRINNEGHITEASDLKASTNDKLGTITYSNSGGLSVTIPQKWVGKAFKRIDESNTRRGYQITEQLEFGPLNISECESFMQK